jgi:hypothetical protein
MLLLYMYNMAFLRSNFSITTEEIYRYLVLKSKTLHGIISKARSQRFVYCPQSLAPGAATTCGFSGRQ